MTESAAQNAPIPTTQQSIGFPPALGLKGREAVLVSPDGEVTALSLGHAKGLLETGAVMVCHGAFTARRLGTKPPARRANLCDVMDLFAFVRPAQPCVPTARGLARALGLPKPESAEDQALLVLEAARRLLEEITHTDGPACEALAATAAVMARAGWAWGPAVLARAGADMPEGHPRGVSGLDVWSRMPEWQERAPRSPPLHQPVAVEEARARLAQLLAPERSPREGQNQYAEHAALAFAPAEEAEAPPLVLAEAGTGIGKTAGYLAPASVWAEKNGGTVWLSTYTKNLQRQIDGELAHLLPDAEERRRRVVIRKGRENYLCLLNFEEAARAVSMSLGGQGPFGGAAPGLPDGVTLGLAARWAQSSRDGDMVGGDFPAWLQGAERLRGLTDRRGECIHAACPHYRKCPIERATRRARHARFVIANHALVMTGAAFDSALYAAKARPQADEGNGRDVPLRLVFDEGHHLFDAADSAFSAHLTGSEMVELRRWVRGPEARGSLRGRGLAERVGDLAGGTEDILRTLRAGVKAAGALPGPGWLSRLRDEAPANPGERFLFHVRQQILARAGAAERDRAPSLETAIHPAIDGMGGAAADLERALGDLQHALSSLAEALRERLEDEAETLETHTRIRIDALARGLERRALMLLPQWRAMLRAVLAPKADDPKPEHVDWFALERLFGNEADMGQHRHYVDPTKPLAEAVLKPAHGVLVTSATLRAAAGTGADEEAEGWAYAERRTGAVHMPRPALKSAIASPFDYAAHTRVIVVRDVARDHADEVAAAFRVLIEASGGGALGLFTAIHRLRAVHGRIASGLEDNGLPLYAQHVDALDTGTLVDIFREEADASLLGTDAVRDGVDVPGRSLRLIVFDRVPWPRPDILHKARRDRFGGRHYDDALAALRLRQAYGRLVRRAQDRGVFIVLDARTPSRLFAGFPQGVEVQRMGLSEAVTLTRSFLDRGAPDTCHPAP